MNFWEYMSSNTMAFELHVNDHNVWQTEFLSIDGTIIIFELNNETFGKMSSNTMTFELHIKSSKQLINQSLIIRLIFLNHERSLGKYVNVMGRRFNSDLWLWTDKHKRVSCWVVSLFIVAGNICWTQPWIGLVLSQWETLAVLCQTYWLWRLWRLG